MRCTVLAGILAAVSAAPTAANDGVAARGLGGVELSHSGEIEMVREDLTISTEEIRVRYEFRNRVDWPVTTLVAFPLPPVSTDDRFAFVLPVDGTANYVGFRAWIDGREVEPQVQTRAKVAGVDVTDLLRELQIPLVPPSVDDNAALSALPDPAWRRLVDSGAAAAYEPERSLEALWSIETLFYWTQTFPALATVTVEHSYRPIKGGFWFFAKELEPDAAVEEWPSRYCPDEAGKARLRDLLSSKPGDHPSAVAQTVDYILTTAQTWAGPIGTFHLTIDKGGPDTVLALCQDDFGPARLQQTGPATYEITLRNWRPSRDLQLMFVPPPLD